MEEIDKFPEVNDVRPTLDEWALLLAETAALRADCTRRKVGAVVFDSDGRIISIGYNGAPKGRPGCLTSGACPRGALSYSECAAGGSYNNCIAVHAEANALLFSPRNELINATIYITHKPCDDCMKLIMGSGVAWVKYPGGEIDVNAI
jgi:dCMP deaminase